jgi:GDP-L-fucose synthase
MKPEDKILILGSRGLVGSALVRSLKARGYGNLLTPGRSWLNLTRQEDVKEYFEDYRPDYVFLAAAKVGGIVANSTHPAEFIYENLSIQTNVINAAHKMEVKKLLFLGSSCIYPKHCAQPIREEYLMSGPLEPTNEAYAVAKIAGLNMCKAYFNQYGDRFISAMPSNLYGPGDNFSLKSSHVLPALIRKFHDAKEAGNTPVTLWGDGSPRRELLHVDDLAEACILLMNHYDRPEPINVGYGDDISIKDLAMLVQQTVGHEGEIIWDTSRPNGTPRKLLDISKIKCLGWRPSLTLEWGIRDTYEWFLANRELVVRE